MEDVYVPFLAVLALYLLIPLFIGKFRCGDDRFYEKTRPTLQQDYAAKDPRRDFAPLT